MIPSNYVQLFKSDYPFALDEDSYINLDMIMVVDYNELDKFERYGKINAVINSTGVYQLDYKLMLTYELNHYFNLELQKEVEREIENILEYIDNDIRQKIKEIISKISDKSVIEEVINVIDLLVKSIRTSYSKKK